MSSRSVWPAGAPGETATLVGWTTWASMLRARSQRASQKPSRPASKAIPRRVMVHPARPPRPHQHCSKPSSASSPGASFFSG